MFDKCLLKILFIGKTIRQTRISARFCFFYLRAIDMERSRQAELRRRLDIVAKAALVNSVKVKKNSFYYY